MENLRYRSAARIIGYIDLVFSAFGLFIVVQAAMALTGVTVLLYDNELRAKLSELLVELNAKFEIEFTETLTEIRHALLWIVRISWGVVGVSTLIVILRLIAAIKLVNSTEVGGEPSGARKKASFWRNVYLVFFFLQVVYHVATGIVASVRFANNSSIYGYVIYWWIYVGVVVVIRASFLSIVCLYIGELGRAKDFAAGVGGNGVEMLNYAQGVTLKRESICE